MNYKKVTAGFVIQEYEDGECVAQEFIAGDEVSREDEWGDSVDVDTSKEVGCSFHMIQPGAKPNIRETNQRLVIGVHGGLVQWVCGNVDVNVTVMDFDVEGTSESELYNEIANIYDEEVHPLSDLEPDVAQALQMYDNKE